MNLRTFIEKTGTRESATLFGVSQRAVLSWRYGERLPRPDTAQRIVQATAAHPNGPVTMNGIYGTIAAAKGAN